MEVNVRQTSKHVTAQGNVYMKFELPSYRTMTHQIRVLPAQCSSVMLFCNRSIKLAPKPNYYRCGDYFWVYPRLMLGTALRK